MARLRHRRLATLVVGVASSVFVLVGCGSTSDDSSGPSKDADTDALDVAFKGDEGVPPTTAPEPVPDATIIWISCGQVTATCASFAAAGEEAAEAIGWNFEILDGNLNQANGYATAMETAIAAKPDAIVQDAFSCATDQPQLEQAKAAGIPVIGVETTDCSDAGIGPELFTIPMVYSETYPSNAAWWTGWGEWAASYIAADSGGEAEIITNPGEGDPQFDFYNEGFDRTLEEKCSDCEVVEKVSWTVSEFGPTGPWVTALQNALLKEPNADYIWMPFDSLAVDSAGAKTVLKSGHKGKLVSGIGYGPALDLLREGQIYAESVARSGDWVSWAAIDQINRHLNGEESVPQGLGFISIDADHNLPSEAGEDYEPSVDFRALYKKAWGVE